MILDTSGLLCLYHQNEPFHQHTDKHFEQEGFIRLLKPRV